MQSQRPVRPLSKRELARIADLDQRLLQLQEEKKSLDARRAASERTARKQRMIIFGAWTFEKYPALLEECKQSLRRPQDRAAFGLGPLDETPNGLTDLAPQNSVSDINQ